MDISQLFNTDLSITQQIEHPLFNERTVKVYVKRDDLIDPYVSGNKWRKLKYNLLQLKTLGKNGVLTFGGAYSNHLLATAYAANKAGVKSVGLVRGDELNVNSNETLSNCADLGMELRFLSREEYQKRNDKDYISAIMSEKTDLLFVPEGGANYYGMIGCQEIIKEVDEDFDAVFVAQGTTTTSCGILTSLKNELLYVVPVLKGFDSVAEMKKVLLSGGMDLSYVDDVLKNCRVLSEYHFGGYGKYTDELIEFIRDIYQTTGLKLDPIYTGKAFYAMFDQIKSGNLDGQSVLFIHTGGLQGVAGVEDKLGTKLFD